MLLPSRHRWPRAPEPSCGWAPPYSCGWPMWPNPVRNCDSGFGHANFQKWGGGGRWRSTMLGTPGPFPSQAVVVRGAWEWEGVRSQTQNPGVVSPPPGQGAALGPRGSGGALPTWPRGPDAWLGGGCAGRWVGAAPLLPPLRHRDLPRFGLRQRLPLSMATPLSGPGGGERIHAPSSLPPSPHPALRASLPPASLPGSQLLYPEGPSVCLSCPSGGPPRPRCPPSQARAAGGAACRGRRPEPVGMHVEDLRGAGGRLHPCDAWSPLGPP